LIQLLGPSRKPDEPLTQRHFDIARSAQVMYENALFHLLNSLHSKYGLDSIAIAGGCGMNSVANGKITEATPFKQVYVQAAAGDAGGAIGSALAVWCKISNDKSFKREPINHAYWGPQFSDDEVENLLLRRESDLKLKKCFFEKVNNEILLCKSTAESIASGQVVGWFQGRMEWGPRALGNRSILGDPRRADMKDILNLKIKRRESFRPFAPSILREEVSTWFENEADVPFMTQVFQIRAPKRVLIPAVTHVDGSGRLQTVDESANPRYYKLISEFRDQTGIPMVLNTSFNENEPVVCYPEQALETFLRTKMDLLVMGSWMIRRYEN
jgi:carbamoyltransferase